MDRKVARRICRIKSKYANIDVLYACETNRNEKSVYENIDGKVAFWSENAAQGVELILNNLNKFHLNIIIKSSYPTTNNYRLLSSSKQRLGLSIKREYSTAQS